jgi:Carboxypeptidase regulatory-like domain/TonB-dependent Receptor Plug Domain/TonB dependent receptor
MRTVNASKRVSHRDTAALLGLLWLICSRNVVLLAIFLAPAFADTARLSGVIFTIDTNKVQTLWPNAHVMLKNLSSGRELATVSNELGQYSFSGVLPGDYELTVALAGFETATKKVSLKSDSPTTLDVELSVQKQSESVNVSGNPTGVDTTSSSGGAPTLTTETLKSLSRLNSDFQDALPLLPGVLRGPDGLIHIKGGNANQSNALINNVSIGDPFTGQPALRLPNAAVESMRVVADPFSSEFGGFSSGVIEVTTRGGGDEWKWLFEDPIPRFRWIDYSTHGVESLTPHLAFSGPLIKGKLFIFQSLYYGYDVVRTPSLPNPNNVRIDQRVNTQTQIDWDINSSQRLTAILTVDPGNTAHANIDTFNPEPVTADYHQRGFFTSFSDRWILASGGFLQSLFSVKQLNADVFPDEPQPGVMTLYPEQNYGSFFETQHWDTWLYQWAQALHLRPVEFGGRHLITVGYAFSRSTYDGFISNLPVDVLREDHTLATDITYGPLTYSSASNNNFTGYAQDSWQLLPRFTLDFGVRLEHESLSSEALNAAPRVGFLLALTKDNRTVLRGGAGRFYGKIPLNVAVFPAFPAQTITEFAADGTTVIQGPTTYAHVIAEPFRLPYSVGTTLQLDRQLYHTLLVRLGYEYRAGYREFFVNPVSPTADQPAQLQLLNSGHQRYDEYLVMLRWHPSERTTLLASYVRSSARGELNDYNQFFGNFAYPLIRPNQYGPLPSDAPNRMLFWAIVGLPYKLQFVPIFDAHTGFPYSQVDENWTYVGQRDQAGRFPAFASLDVKLQYPFDFKFRGHRIQFLGGLKVIDVTNHYNPRDVQQYLGSPNYGVFYNSVGRLWRIDGDFDF